MAGRKAKAGTVKTQSATRRARAKLTQHEPHEAWSLTGLSAPDPLQSTVVGSMCLGTRGLCISACWPSRGRAGRGLPWLGSMVARNSSLCQSANLLRARLWVWSPLWLWSCSPADAKTLLKVAESETRHEEQALKDSRTRKPAMMFRCMLGPWAISHLGFFNPLNSRLGKMPGTIQYCLKDTAPDDKHAADTLFWAFAELRL